MRELFERIRRDRKRIALATSGGSEEMDVYEKLTGIENLVDEKISGGDAQKTKPCPDIFEAALQKLHGCAPNEVIAVGDTPYDAEAATKVKIEMIGVLCGGFSKNDLGQCNVVGIYRDPADLLAHYESCPIASAVIASQQFRYFQFLTFPSPSHSIDVASLCLRVSSRFASVTHSTYSRRWLVLKFSKVFRAFAFFLSAAPK